MPDLSPGIPERLAEALEGRYRIDRQLGQGGMSTVWMAEDLRHGRKVAIKVLRADLAASLGSDRFLREIRIAAQLQHPHILGLIDSGEARGAPGDPPLLYYVMPLVDGESLRDRIDRQGPLPLGLVLRWLREVADALAKAHRAGVIHRDVKPDNILIADEHALVVDFGIARAVTDAAPQSMLTGVGVTVGTPAYMAPEQVVADPGLDHRADLYSLGIVGYEMLAGHPPFVAGTPQQLLAAQVTQQPTPVAQFRPDAPPAISSLIMRLLAKEPDARLPDADAVVAQLESLGSGAFDVLRTAELALPAPAATPRAPAQSARSRARLAGMIAGVAVIAAVTFIAFRPGSGKGATPADDGRSLAVLPLANLSADSSQDYFSDGLSEEILGAVSRIPGLRVAAHTSSFALKGTKLPVEEIGKKLGVRHVLEGSVQREGENVRVRARLVDAQSGFQVWDGKYDKQSNNLFALEDEVSSAIAAALTAHLGVTATAAPAATGNTENSVAHDAYLRGRQYLRNRGSAADLREAIVQFEAALALDSSYARAWAGLGTAQVLLPEYGGASVDKSVVAARRSITRALVLDSASAEANAAMGYLEKSYEWDWKGAEAGYDRALALDPNAAGTWQWKGELLDAVGRHDEAGIAFEKAVTLDPVSPVAQMALGAHLVAAGRRSDGRKAFEQSLTLQPQLWPAMLQLMFMDIADGKANDAATMARRAAPILGFDGDRAATMVSQQDGGALAISIATVEGWMREQKLPALAGASWLALLGANDQAFNVLDQMVSTRAPFSSYIPWWPFLGKLGEDPRMTPLRDRLLGSSAGSVALKASSPRFSQAQSLATSTSATARSDPQTPPHRTPAESRPSARSHSRTPRSPRGESAAAR